MTNRKIGAHVVRGRWFRHASFVIGISSILRISGMLAAADWRLAEPGWIYDFPRDHFVHPSFKTEWWYFTGNVRTAEGRRFGYQVTFFRQGVRPPPPRGNERSRFIVDDLKFAHFALTDVAGQRFHFQQKLSRGAFGESGFSDGGKREADAGEHGAAPRSGTIAWIDDWQLTRPGPNLFRLAAASGEMRVAFDLTERKPWTIHGDRGISQKADGAGHASHYYSGTRLATRGEIQLAGRAFAVTGDTWFDHEWATNQLTATQAGWNWFSLQFDDGTELMLYQMRLRGGGLDPNSSGTFIAADGTARHLTRDDYTLRPLAEWPSAATRARYPIEWDLSIPSLQLSARITTPVREQELVLTPIAYWEGVVDVRGTRAGAELKGRGYMELTGYAGELVGLSAQTP